MPSLVQTGEGWGRVGPCVVYLEFAVSFIFGVFEWLFCGCGVCYGQGAQHAP